MNSMLLRRKLKVVVAEGSGELPLAVTATFQKNLESFGFRMSPELFARVGTLSTEQAASLYKRLTRELQVMRGAHRRFEPLYPNFPEQVMRADRAELYWNAMLHYWGLQGRVGTALPRPALDETVVLLTLDLGTQGDVDAIFMQLAASKSPYSAQDRDDVRWYVAQYRDRAFAALPTEIPCKENLAILLAAFLSGGAERAAAPETQALGRHARTATDVLRIAAALNDGDVSLALPSRFGRFSRALRRTLLEWLEAAPNRLEDMQRWRPRWIRLGERLHPGEYAVRLPGMAADFAALRAGQRAQSFNSQVENALAGNDTQGAIALLRKRPGELARRLDVLARRGPADGAGAEAAIEAFAQCADTVSTPVLLQVLTHFRRRGESQDLRVFFPKGQVANLYAVKDRLPALSPTTCAALAAVCERTLIARFASLPPLGACYLAPDMRRYLVPFSQRSAAKSLRTIVRGSRVPMPAGNTLRFFVWWRNGNSRADIDLSAVMYGENFKYADTLSYYNLRNFGAHHSGDIVDAPKGASEFIDVDIERCRRNGVRWILMSLSSYTEQPYCDLPECFAGWMARSKPNSGEIYEPSTVVDRFDLASDTTFCLPVAFDLVERQALWCDIALRSYPRFRVNVANNLAGVSLMLRALSGLRKTDLHTLFDLHIRARGHAVNEIDAAQTVFAPDRGITPSDLPRIASEFM